LHYIPIQKPKDIWSINIQLSAVSLPLAVSSLLNEFLVLGERMLILKSGTAQFQERLEQIIHRRELIQTQGTEEIVQEIIQTVKAKGDEALIEYTLQFDRCCLSKEQLIVSEEEVKQAYQSIDNKTLDALKLATHRIKEFHQQQQTQLCSWTRQEEGGCWAGQLIQPIERVGVYVPGGKAVYPSSVLMNIIPARVAGVKEVVLCTPPAQNNQNMINPYILIAADLAQTDKIFKVGGAQAIAALAFGTETIPKVDKVVGPGNIYVSTAKRQVFGEVGIDSIAGPSEIVILADKTAKPEFIAADLLAQAEHDDQAVAVLITDTDTIARAVVEEIEKQVVNLPRQDIIRTALNRWGTIFLVKSQTQALELANQIGPEHLLLMLGEPGSILAGIKHAGAVFLGNYSPVALGDYLAGPNHVLPTGNTARFFSPLGVYDFIKRTNFLYVSSQASSNLVRSALVLARLEGLEAHAQSLLCRAKPTKG
jgi:histidinol dehydrogenase